MKSRLRLVSNLLLLKKYIIEVEGLSEEANETASWAVLSLFGGSEVGR